MQRQGRNASGGRPAGFNDPFGDFAGFGGFGFGRSMMRDFFGHDPFDDPFFTRPFGSGFGFGFGSDLLGPRPEGGFLEQRPFNQQQEARRGPIIEEIDGDHSDGEHRRRDEPIVEHPDDDARADPRSSRNLRQQGPLTNQRNGNSNFQSYSFQSSSMSFGGPNGNYYVSSSKRSAGPNGVVHEEHHEKDSASGQESHRVSKGIYDKGHSVTRKRNAEGREETLDTLHNLQEAEMSEFDKRWEAEAETVLPGWSKSKSSRALGGSGSGSSSNAAMRALPGAPATNNTNNASTNTGTLTKLRLLAQRFLCFYCRR